MDWYTYCLSVYLYVCTYNVFNHPCNPNPFGRDFNDVDYHLCTWVSMLNQRLIRNFILVLLHLSNQRQSVLEGVLHTQQEQLNQNSIHNTHTLTHTCTFCPVI